jgi:hypothetical protein
MAEAQGLRTGSMAQDATRGGPERQGRSSVGGRSWRSADWRLHGPVLALLAAGAALGLALWGRWGFLVAFDTIRAYCL